MSRQVKEVSFKSYVATLAFNNDFFTYATSMDPKTFNTRGALTSNTALKNGVVVSVAAGDCPAGRILRENGRKLYPGAHNGVSTVMVGVFDNQAMQSGFIDPNSPLFAVYSTDRPNYLVDAVDPAGGLTDQSAPVLTNGSVVADGQVRSSTVKALTTVSNATTLDVSLGQVFTMTTSANVTISVTNVSPGAQVFLIVTGGGSHTITFGANMWGMGTLAVTNTDIFVVHFVADSTNLYEVSRSMKPSVVTASGGGTVVTIGPLTDKT
jgi:hypothetical protein